MREELICLCCGKPFKPSCHKTRQKYCSRECCIKYSNAKRYFSVQVGTCPECGKHIEQTGERGRLRRFCSDRCRIEYHGKKEQERKRSIERTIPTAVKSLRWIGACEGVYTFACLPVMKNR